MSFAHHLPSRPATYSSTTITVMLLRPILIKRRFSGGCIVSNTDVPRYFFGLALPFAFPAIYLIFFFKANTDDRSGTRERNGMEWVEVRPRPMLSASEANKLIYTGERGRSSRNRSECVNYKLQWTWIEPAQRMNRGVYVCITQPIIWTETCPWAPMNDDDNIQIVETSLRSASVPLINWGGYFAVTGPGPVRSLLDGLTSSRVCMSSNIARRFNLQLPTATALI